MLEISVSKVQTFMRCPRSYKLRYIDRVIVPVSKAIWLGQQFAKIRANICSGIEWVIDQVPEGVNVESEDIIKLESIAKRLEEDYDKLPHGKQEGEIRYRYNGIDVVGYYDQLDGDVLYEWKYSDSEDRYNILSVHLQASVYLYGLPHVNKFTLVIAKKSKLRLKKGESLEEFRDRVSDSYRDSDYLLMKEYRRKDFRIVDELEEMTQVVRMMELCKEREIYPKNTKSCDFCEYTSHCNLGIDREEAYDVF